MKIYLEYHNEKSHKFWKIEVRGSTHTVSFGKVGTKGQKKTKEFASSEKAQNDAKKLASSKLKKGYVEVKENIEDSLGNPEDQLDIKLSTLAEIIDEDLYELDLEKIESGEHDFSKQVTLIEVKSLQSSSCLLEAMDRILEMAETDFKQLISESWSAYGGIFFVFHDDKGNYLSEREFFNTVITLQGGADKVEKLIRIFIMYEGFDETYRNVEELALVFAVEALGLYDAKYLDTVLVFLWGVDWEHDVYNQGTLVPALASRWSREDVSDYLSIGLSLVLGEAHYNPCYFGEGIDSDWIEDEENQGIILDLIRKAYINITDLGKQCKCPDHLFRWMNEHLEEMIECIKNDLTFGGYDEFFDSLDELVEELIHNKEVKKKKKAKKKEEGIEKKGKEAAPPLNLGPFDPDVLAAARRREDGSLLDDVADRLVKPDPAILEQHKPGCAHSRKEGVKKVAARFGHTLFIGEDGVLWMTGINDNDQVIGGVDRLHREPIQALVGVIDAAVGNAHTIVLLDDGTLWGIGSNDFGQLGDGTFKHQASLVPVASDVKAVRAGAFHTLILQNNGVLWAVGWNEHASLGDGRLTNRAIPIPILKNVIDMEAGLVHSMAIKKDGSLMIFGFNGNGQLATGDYEIQPTPIKVADDVQRISLGSFHSTMIKNDGSLWTVGSGHHYQLGTGDNQPVLEWKRVNEKVISSGAGESHTLVVKDDGTLWAAGANDKGQFGNGSKNWSNTLPDMKDVKAVAAGLNFSLFLKKDNTVWGAGANSLYPWGTEEIGRGDIRVPVSVMKDIDQVFAGETKSLFIKTDRTLWGIGADDYGEFGKGNGGGSGNPILLAEDVKSAALGDKHILILKNDGSVWGAGLNDHGQLGVGDGSGDIYQIVHGRKCCFKPVKIMEKAIAVWAGPSRSFFLTEKGLFAAGRNHLGQLGDGTKESRSVPTYIADDVISVACGYGHTMLLKSDSSLWGAGYNGYGQLGDGSCKDHLAPVKTAEGVKSVTAGESCTLIIKTDYSCWAAGEGIDNMFGEHRTGANFKKIMDDTIDVSVGKRHTLILKKDGTPLAVGSNVSGQLGNESNKNQWIFTAPVDGEAQRQIFIPIAGMVEKVKQAVCGALCSYVVKEDGSVWAAGDNEFGQLGQRGIDEQLTFFPICFQKGESIIEKLRREKSAAEQEKKEFERIGNIEEKTIVQIAANRQHAFIVTEDGVLWAVGKNNQGQLGENAPENRLIPTPIMLNVEKVGAAAFTTLILKRDKTLWGCGWNGAFQLGDGTEDSRLVPTQIADNVKDFSTGRAHTLFVKTDGALWGMGENRSGELGTGKKETEKIPIKLMEEVKMAVCADEYSLVLKSNGDLYAMGYSYDRGTGLEEDALLPTFIMDGVKTISAVNQHSLIVKEDGSVWSAGQNSKGQLGDGSCMDREKFVKIAENGRAVYASIEHSAIIKNDGSLWTMGCNERGRLAGGWLKGDSKLVQPITDVKDVAAGDHHTLFIKNDGTLWGCGENVAQLADGTTNDRRAPVKGQENVIKAFTRRGNTFFIKADDTLWGVGNNNYSCLGVGETEGLGCQEAPLQAMEEVKSAAFGSDFSLMLQKNGTLWGVGYRRLGRLGAVLEEEEYEEEKVIKIAEDVEEVAAGADHTLVLKKDGTLWGTGRNRYGQLAKEEEIRLYALTQMTENVKAISGGNNHSMILKRDGTLWAVGSNKYGQLGISRDVDAIAQPVQVAEDVQEVSANFNHTMFIKADKTLWGMGNNKNGQLGDETTDNIYRPKQVAEDAVAVSTGLEHTVFIKNDGSLWGAGNGEEGQLGYRRKGSDIGFTPIFSGNGRVTEKNKPWKVAEDVKQAALGERFTLYLKNDGSLWGSGENECGQLADGTTKDKAVPTRIY